MTKHDQSIPGFFKAWPNPGWGVRRPCRSAWTRSKRQDLHLINLVQNPHCGKYTSNPHWIPIESPVNIRKLGITHVENAWTKEHSRQGFYAVLTTIQQDTRNDSYEVPPRMLSAHTHTHTLPAIIGWIFEAIGPVFSQSTLAPGCPWKLVIVTIILLLKRNFRDHCSLPPSLPMIRPFCPRAGMPQDGRRRLSGVVWP